MNGTMRVLALRRKRLLALIARQRIDLAQDTQILKPPLAAIDRGISAAHYLGKHPIIPAVAATAFVVLKPARAFKWMRRGWFFWGLYRNARNRLRENG